MAEVSRGATKEAFWRRMVQAQSDSGLSIRAWCRDQDLKDTTFYWWRRELTRRDTASSSPAFPSQPPTLRVRQPADRASRDPAKTAVKPSSRQGLRATSVTLPKQAEPIDSPPSFVPVHVAKDNIDADDRGSQIEITWPDGRSVRVTGTIDRQALADVLDVLADRLC